MIRPTPRHLATLAALACAGFLSGCASDEVRLASFENAYADSYAVVVSEKTYADPEWKEVADLLVKKRRATLIVHPGDDITAAKAELTRVMPLHTAFVARPEECGRRYIAAVHRLTRDLDSDPYADTIWGVITGRDAAGAKRVAGATRPIVADTVLATTGVNLENFRAGFVISDGKAGDWSEKTVRDGIRHGNGRDEPDAAIWAKEFESMRPKLLITSSHGFQNGFEMPFGRGYVATTPEGTLRTYETAKRKKELGIINPENSARVWLAAGNCLIGHIEGRDSIIPVMMSNYGVDQAAAYTVATWNGAAGWGSLAQWNHLSGRYSLAEAVWINQQAIVAELLELDPVAVAYNPVYDETDKTILPDKPFINAARAGGVTLSEVGIRLKKSPEKRVLGLLWDRDTFAFFGDPKLEARLPYPKEDQIFSTHIEQIGSNKFRLTVTVNNHAEAAVNERPLCTLFTMRLKNPRILTGEQYAPVLTDNFLLLRKAHPIDRERELVIEFEGEPVRD